ncbi:F-box/FBD/LRR-repeat protein At4g26340-like [Lotus japonicus]|uniref:F-box/FBD/LRR-repeat protein At4g26340-like n=1 Tax=Lotus japonicus TaxID=34305 RepID=UPI0025863E59|nr:F-box/FBD/LRR-repeat protein At4g26340-like [Lotus japonicus]
MDDRISTLPDEILHYILSFLPAEEAVATSVLSKRWNPLRLSLTSLSLDLGRRHPLNAAQQQGNIEEADDTYLYVVLLRKISVPRSIFSCKTLVVLKLKGGNVRNFYNFDFPSLKALHLNELFFSENRCLVELLYGCPVLEHLEAHYIYFESDSSDQSEYKILPKLVCASIRGMRNPLTPLIALSNAKFLQLVQCVNTDFPVFSNLIHLEIIFPMKIVPWSFVFNTLKNSPKLRFLVLDMQRIIRPSPLFGNGVNDEVFCYPDSVAECLRSQFRKCTLENYSGVQNEKQFAEYIMLNSTCLHTMEIQCQPSMNPEEKLEMLKELFEILYSFCNLDKMMGEHGGSDDSVWMAKRWILPPAGTVNLCSDGSFNPVSNQMGSGGVIRDSQGVWLCGFHSFEEGGNALLAEAKALKIGLQLTWDRGFRSVECNMDCRTLVSALEDP